jgi:hypothetical protein
MRKEEQKNIIESGSESGAGLRETSRYETTQMALLAGALIETLAGKVTPPVGLNLRILAEQMPFALQKLAEGLPDKPECSLLGLAIVDGIDDVARVLGQVGRTSWSRLNVVEIDEEMVDKVNDRQLPTVQGLLEDARDTSLSSLSQDLIIRDHLGNCCPPEMYAQIEMEVRRLLAPDGFSLVNITTNERLLDSPERETIRLAALENMLGQSAILALRNRIFDLAQLRREFPTIDTTKIRGKILEILPNSFVVFGEDEVGHGEWFSTWEWQMELWQQNGFVIIDHQSRLGQDSHQPPLECVRHIVLLERQASKR